MTHLSVQFLLAKVGSLIIQRAADRREMKTCALSCCYTVLILKLKKSSVVMFAAKNTHLLLVNDFQALITPPTLQFCFKLIKPQRGTRKIRIKQLE